MRDLFMSIFLVSLGAWAGIGTAQVLRPECGSLDNNRIGPWDYRSSDQLGHIERAHFNSSVEFLRRGQTSMTPGGDMAYILRVFPNHHRALMATVKFAQKTKKNPPPEMSYTVECWFERAERFKPDDAMVKTIYGIYLIQSGKAKNGAEQLEAAAELAGDNGNIRYNLGLAYFQLKQYDLALDNAHRAYRLGFPLPGLRNMLQRAGKWRDVAPELSVSPEAADASRTAGDAVTGLQPEK